MKAMSVDIIIDRMTAKKLVPAPSPPPPGNAFITLRMDLDDNGRWGRIEGGIAEGETSAFEWNTDRRMSFDHHVKLALTQEQGGTGDTVDLGCLVVRADEINLGPRNHQFVDHGAHFDVAYRVIPHDV
jgi:hypothetical protein